MRRRQVAANAAPGTGTQTKSIALPPDSDSGAPCIARIGNTKWDVGAKYFDTETNTLVKLVRVIRRSSWCNTGDVDEAPPGLVFERETGTGTARVDVGTHDALADAADRFYRLERPDESGTVSPWDAGDAVVLSPDG
jgi:hypothetical protein